MIGSVLLELVVVIVVGLATVVAVVDSGSEFGFTFFKAQTEMTRTNPNMTSPRSVRKMRKREQKPMLHLFCFLVDTCPSLDGLTG